jgi:two-component system nitrogen regulation sensor histidine kinase GlnL
VKLDAARLHALVEGLRVGIVIVDTQERVELVNLEASRILGIPSESARRRELSSLVGFGHPAAVLVAQVRKSGGCFAQNGCSLPTRTDRGTLLVDLSAAPLGVGVGEEGAVLTLVDRTMGQELEALVAQRASDALFQHLASGIAHEIRNPLSGISGAAELLSHKLTEPALKRYPELIRSETDRIRRLLDDLAQLTTGRDIVRASVNLHQILDGILAMQTSTRLFRGVSVVREYDPSIPEMMLDADRITQIFLNLVRNAAQAASAASHGASNARHAAPCAVEGREALPARVTVRTRIEALFHLSDADGTRQRMVRIDVEDTGSGIPASDIPHIFTPFFTTKVDGTGLGLSVAQHWVVRHGGRICVERAHAGGTCMRVLLPLGRRS